MAFEENLEKWLSRCSLFARSRLSRLMFTFGIDKFAGASSSSVGRSWWPILRLVELSKDTNLAME